jgi:uncharacterized membrane protein
MDKSDRHSRYRKWGLGLVMSWLLVYALLLGSADLAVVPFTANGDWAGLEFAESYLTPVCHRMPSRSFWLAGVPMGLCARCTGIYAGLALVLLLALGRGRHFTFPFKAAAALILLALLDGTLQHFAMYESGNTARAIVGAGYGAGIAALFHCMLQRESRFFPSI